MTSGLGGVYPKGLRLGRVSELRDAGGRLTKIAIVEPAVDLGRLEQVFLTWPNNPGARYYAARAAEQLGDFERAMRRKLVRELTVPNLSRRDPGPRYEMVAAGDGQRRPLDGGPAGDAAPGVRR